MKQLELRNARSYTPQEAGLETPLLFRQQFIYLVFLPNSFLVRATDLETRLDWLTVKAQVSAIQYDQATLPVWIIKGKLPDGFFSGVLRPGFEKQLGQIDIFKDQPQFNFFLELPDLVAVGKGKRDKELPEAMMCFAQTEVDRTIAGKITADFEWEGYGKQFSQQDVSDLTGIMFRPRI